MIFVFDMDGTLLVNTTACMEIAKITKTEKELLSLEEKYQNGDIDAHGFAQIIHKLWGTLDMELIEKSFVKSEKLKNIQNVIQKIKERKSIAVIITMSPDFFAKFFYSYGFDHIYASCFPRSETENLNPVKLLTPRDKPRIVMELCKKYHYTPDQCIAFGDSMSDYPLFQILKETVAINGDPRIESKAKYSYKGYDLAEAVSVLNIL
ncbi:MAG: HAD family phosphatase [Spirochaetales bacterium]|nr:HAD family phosphatase [Spirochaetales bacterium]